MDLEGWKYKGRKISKQLDMQILHISNMLQDQDVVKDKTWPQIQTVIADKLGIESGQVRTIKVLMEDLGIINSNSLNSSNNINSELIFTESGNEVLELFKLEEHYDQFEKDGENYTGEIELLHNVIQAYYRKLLINYQLINSDNIVFHPLKITLKALDKYDSLDFWEWYMLNTLITHDDSEEDEKNFDEAINKYRNGEIIFSDEDIKNNILSHSYILSSFGEVGYLNLDKSGKQLKATINPECAIQVDYVLGR